MRFKVIKSRATLLPLLLLAQVLQVFDATAQVTTSLVKGIVRSVNKEPLVGISVVIRKHNSNFTTGTTTDTTGVFTTRVPSGGPYSFSLSMVGYDAQTLNGYHILEDTTLSLVVELKSTATSLDQVVVVGYGIRRRSDITGSIATVPRERLSQLPVTNALQAVQGAVAGVQISQGSSVPGAAPSVIIRGESSISASTSPFIVVDGVPFNGSLNDITPNDIASIDILKDASATAIYGTRGANGVLLISTRRGQTGETKISYSGYGGIEEFAHRVKPMSAEQYVQKYADFKAQAGINNTNVLPNTSERDNYDAGITTDWIDEISQQGYIHSHNINIQGGYKDVQFYVSGDYLKQQGVVKGYQFNRASIRFFFNFGGSLGGIQQEFFT